MLRALVLVLLLAAASVGATQEDGHARQMRFAPVFHGKPLMLDQPDVLATGTAVSVSRFRFYVSHVMLLYKGSPVYADTACHLVDASVPASLDIPLALGRRVNVDSLSFLLGIDSSINVSGAFGGDLDPSKGMYWTWNSGYINLKLEGTSPSCSSLKQAFQFHLGGYLPPYLSAQRIGQRVPGLDVITVQVEVADLLEHADLAKRCSVMSPGADAVELSRFAATLFTLVGND
jgi:hypothetical protein